MSIAEVNLAYLKRNPKQLIAMLNCELKILRDLEFLQQYNPRKLAPTENKKWNRQVTKLNMHKADIAKSIESKLLDIDSIDFAELLISSKFDEHEIKSIEERWMTIVRSRDLAAFQAKQRSQLAHVRAA